MIILVLILILLILFNLGQNFTNVSPKKIAVITSIYGNYESIKNQDNVKDKELFDWYCFTDNENLKSNLWTIINKPYHLLNTTGNFNIAMGTGALINMTVGNSNVAIGQFGGEYDISGNNNTYLGTYANLSTSISSTSITQNSTAVGSFATIDASNQMVLGGLVSGSYPNVKIPGSYLGIGGVYGPSGGYALDVSGNAKINGGITGATGSFTYLSASQQISAPAGITGATGSFTYLSGTNSSFTNITVSGTATVNGLLTAAGGITGATGSFNYLYSTNTVTASDYRIKENVTPLNDTYVVDELIPVTYTNKITERQDMGLIAHELQEVFPFLVNGEKDGKDYQSVNYTGLIPLLIKEVKELKEKVKSIEEKLKK